MLPIAIVAKVFVGPLVALTAHTIMVSTWSPQEKLYQAYYLHHAEHDYAAAVELYEQVAKARGVDREIRQDAERYLAECREELASEDFAELMPPRPLAYVELNRPGERVKGLMREMGLLGKAGGAATDAERRVAVSPALIEAALGMRGAALAVTGFDPGAQRPRGVVVFHPGEMDVVRGLIETALPVGAEILQPIRGYPTYEVEGVYVTLTKRIAIVGTGLMEIEGVVDRLRDPDADSLADDPEWAELLARRNDSLVFFALNPKPIMPLLQMGLAAGASQSREAALAQALLDLRSLNSVTGRFDVSERGVLLEFSLRLDEGHRNLVYNFFRRPAVDEATLRCIPAGAAGFLALAMNEAPDDYDRAPRVPGDPRIVTALDLGRELFANINGIAVYALPPTETNAAGRALPDVAATLTVNDPAKSEALWTQLLGIASLAAGGVTMDGTTRTIEGVDVRSYQFAEAGFTVYFGSTGHHLFIAATEAALRESLSARASGSSVLTDAAFRPALEQIDRHTTFALVAHPARCMKLAQPHMSAHDVREMRPVAEMMTETVAALTVTHSNRELRLRADVTGVPDVGAFVSRMINEERREQEERQELTRALKRGDWDAANATINERLARMPGDTGLLRKRFDIAAVHAQDAELAEAAADELIDALDGKPRALNNFAWALLTEEKYGNRYDEVALRCARRANELTDHENWYFLDTLALGEYRAGHAERAVELEGRAIEICEQAGGSGVDALREALARFRGDVLADEGSR